MVEPLDLTSHLKDEIQDFVITQQKKLLHTGRYAFGFFKVQKFDHVSNMQLKTSIIQE